MRLFGEYIRKTFEDNSLLLGKSDVVVDDLGKLKYLIDGFKEILIFI